MSVLPIFRTLKADANIATLIDVEIQVYEDIAPQGTKPPYIVWQTISGQALNHLDEAAVFDNTQYQLMVYDASTRKADEVRDAVRVALEKHSWVLNPSINLRDNKAKLYGRGFDANWIAER
ncbi:DUF3168 domain-containing protein [Psychrobacter sp. APC 3426]|uniref:DUF3168 domain-containing protein n=1 Tax=Psychrobacter sp. APC 3426 TaxID=3035177 RepID=UPI0025B3B22D|nr:DUF3168 domain-containing protein [Psychrobacter sp. APC 3426]MDN3397694.1 DUF3168 domain-containing protein [Psychrobacter sp. APC 3426]